MPQYFVAGYLPDDFDRSQADEATGREIHALNKEMIAAGVRKFACGLGPAKSLLGADRWRSPRHRRTVPRGQGTHRRFLDIGMR
jgi:hypothetical protein